MKKNKIIILGHENPDIDSIISGILLEFYLNKYTNHQAEFVIPDQTLDKDTKEICKKYQIPYKKYQRKLLDDDEKIILVDHFEREIGSREIIAICDHHPTTKKISTKFYLNQQISSTAALIVQGHEQFFSKDLLKLAILATYVDTASFNSTKAREKDKIWAETICKQYNFNQDELYQTGLMLTDLSNLNEAAFTGLKKYQIKDKKVEVSSIQINKEKINPQILIKIKEIILNYYISNNLDVFILIIHDMGNMKSSAYKIFKDGIEIVEYDKYTSRGNVIIPELEKELINHNFKINKIKAKK